MSKYHGVVSARIRRADKILKLLFFFGVLLQIPLSVGQTGFKAIIADAMSIIGAILIFACIIPYNVVGFLIIRAEIRDDALHMKRTAYWEKTAGMGLVAGFLAVAAEIASRRIHLHSPGSLWVSTLHVGAFVTIGAGAWLVLAYTFYGLRVKPVIEPDEDEKQVPG